MELALLNKIDSFNYQLMQEIYEPQTGKIPNS